MGPKSNTTVFGRKVENIWLICPFLVTGAEVLGKHCEVSLFLQYIRGKQVFPTSINLTQRQGHSLAVGFQSPGNH